MYDRAIALAPWLKAGQPIFDLWTADSLRGRFARGAVWSLFGAVASQGSSLIASVVTARLLGRNEFGQYGIVQSTVGTFGLFAGLGLGVTATKYVAEFRTRDPQRAARIIALGTSVAFISGGVLAVLLLLFARTLATKTLGGQEITSELRIASLLLFLNAINGAQIGALAGFEAFRHIARINLTRGVVALPATVALVLLWGLPGAIWALVFTAALGCLLSMLSLRSYSEELGVHATWSSGWAERRVLWTFSMPAVLSSALAGPALWAANAMLVNRPDGYAQMGLFSAGTQWRNAIGFVPVVLTQFALPLLSNLNGERDALRYKKALRWNLILTGAAASAVALPVAACAPLIMRLYGREFEQGWAVLAISAGTAIIASVNGVVGTAIISGGSIWVGFIFNALWAATLLVGCHYLITDSSAALGLALAVLLAYAAHSVWQSVYLHHRFSHSTICLNDE